MKDETHPETGLVRKWPILFVFLIAGIGIALLNEAADSWRVHSCTWGVALQILGGVGCVIGAMRRGAKHI